MFDFHTQWSDHELVRSYGQVCALAKALDVIGDRWTLLIVRELLIRGGCRYTDLRDGLPGIATNLLAERLDELTQSGVISREAASPPIATSLFRLTERGRQLEPAIEALGRWGAPLLATASGKDAFRSHWLALPLRMCVRDTSPSAKPLRLEVRSGGKPIAVETVGDGSVTARLGSLDDPDATLEGPPRIVLGLLTGKLDLAIAQRKGLKYEGDRRIVRRFVGRCSDPESLSAIDVEVIPEDESPCSRNARKTRIRNSESGD